MKLYDGGRAPNPRRVRIFLSEKAVQIPLVPVDIGKLEHKSEQFAAVNPRRRVPALQLDDGTVIAESFAICRYIEALHPNPPLFGTGAREQALVEMWNRRVELELLFGVAQVLRHTHPAMAALEVPQVPQWGEVNRARVAEFLSFLDQAIAGRRFIAGDTFSVADITALVAVDLMKPVKMAVPDGLTHLGRWHAGVSARPSAGA
jgi:glutathione S-transferase